MNWLMKRNFIPINKEEFEAGKLHSKVEEKIISFLNEKKRRSFHVPRDNGRNTLSHGFRRAHYAQFWGKSRMADYELFILDDIAQLLEEILRHSMFFYEQPTWGFESA